MHLPHFHSWLLWLLVLCRVDLFTLEVVAGSYGLRRDVEAEEGSSCSILPGASRTPGRAMQSLHNTPGFHAGFPPVPSSAQIAFRVLQWHRALGIKLDAAKGLNNSHLLLRDLKPTSALGNISWIKQFHLWNISPAWLFLFL